MVIVGKMVVLSVHMHISFSNVRSNRSVYSHDPIKAENVGYEVCGYFCTFYLNVINKNRVTPESECLMTSIS